MIKECCKSIVSEGKTMKARKRDESSFGYRLMKARVDHGGRAHGQCMAAGAVCGDGGVETGDRRGDTILGVMPLLYHDKQC